MQLQKYEPVEVSHLTARGTRRLAARIGSNPTAYASEYLYDALLVLSDPLWVTDFVEETTSMQTELTARFEYQASSVKAAGMVF